MRGSVKSKVIKCSSKKHFLLLILFDLGEFRLNVNVQQLFYENMNVKKIKRPSSQNF